MITLPTHNTTLIPYGIQNEGSDVRAHVCFKAGYVYLYATSQGKKTVEKKVYPQRPAYQVGIKTAMGYLVPPQDIEGCKWYPIPKNWIAHPMLQILDGHSAGEKGDRATRIIANMFALNKMPLWVPGTSITIIKDNAIQMVGVDLTIRVDIQVKCDLIGGHREFGGTGNLFLQTHECNPFRIFGVTTRDRRPEARERAQQEHRRDKMANDMQY